MTRRGLGPHQLQVFTLHLSLMINSGIHLATALDAAARSTPDPRFREMLEEVGRAVDSGASLSQALGEHPYVFSGTYVRLVRLAEESGALTLVFHRLYDYLERTGRLRRRLLSALTYPAFVLTSSLLMVAFMLYVMLPNFLKMSSMYGSEEPALTRFVLHFALNPTVCLTGLVLAAGLGEALVLAWRRPGGRARLEAAMLRTPWLGPFLTDALWARWCRELGILLSCGMELSRSLAAMGRDSTGFAWMDQRQSLLRDRVLKGIELSRSVREAQGPQLVAQLLHCGESTGRLGYFLERYADLMEEDLARRLEDLTSLLEPLLLAFLGLVVGFILLAVFLPTYQLLLAV